MGYFAVDLIVLMIVVAAYSYKNKSLKGGLAELKQLATMLLQLPAVLKDLNNQLREIREEEQKKHSYILERIGFLSQEVNENFVKRLDHEKDQNFLLKQMKSFTEDYVPNGRFRAFGGDLVRDIENVEKGLRTKASKKDAVKVLEAVASLERSLEARLTPVRPTKNSRAKLKVVKKGR